MLMGTGVAHRRNLDEVYNPESSYSNNGKLDSTYLVDDVQTAE